MMSNNGRKPLRQHLSDQPLAPQPSDDAHAAHGDRQPVPAPTGLGHGGTGMGPGAQDSLYGLAADLAGVGSIPVVSPTAGHLAARPPARLGPARSNRQAVPQLLPLHPPARPPARPTSATASAPVPDPFAVAGGQRQQVSPEADAALPYGLALELLNNQDPAFATPAPAADRRSERERRRGSRPGVARLGAPDRAAVTPPPPSQPAPLDPFTVMELAAKQEGLPEPDYGFVAELRNREAPDPFASEFGLAAEVARRRSRSKSPLGRGVGTLPPLRARRRMDPVAPPGSEGGFGLADDIAERQRQEAADRAEPFGAAARAAGDTDPFALADEQLKIPRELIDPYEPTQQELPGENVRLKTPGDDASETSAVSRDDQQYGIADELGADPATGRRQGEDAFGMSLPGETGPSQYDTQEQPEPPGHKYTYDEDTGMLSTTAGGQGDGGRLARQYIEDEVTGTFYKLQSKRRKLFAMLRRKGPVATEDEEDDDDDKGFRGRLRRTLVTLVTICNILGMFAQGLLGGFAILNFFQTYMLYSKANLTSFLSYYSPLAQNNNRIYYSLLVFALISSAARLARDKLRNFEPRRLLLLPVDWGQTLLYLVAYIASVLCTPLDDELTYEYDRNPRFYQLTFSKAFKKRLAIWHLLNLVRTICVGFGWVLTCYQTSPYVFDTTLRADLRAWRKQERDLRSSVVGRGAAVATDARTPLKAA